jgi:hypothetical protein
VLGEGGGGGSTAMLGAGVGGETAAEGKEPMRSWDGWWILRTYLQAHIRPLLYAPICLYAPIDTLALCTYLKDGEIERQVDS